MCRCLGGRHKYSVQAVGQPDTVEMLLLQTQGACRGASLQAGRSDTGGAQLLLRTQIVGRLQHPLNSLCPFQQRRQYGIPDGRNP